MISINEGTQTPILSIENDGTAIPYVKLDAGVGSAVQDWGGTIPAVARLLTGTVTVAGGTILGGTVQNLVGGTVTQVTNLSGGTLKLNMTPVNVATSITVLGTTGAAVIGTIVSAAGAGTKQYISGLSIVVQSGTVDVAITNVGTVAGPVGAGVLARGQFPPGQGIRAHYNPVSVSGDNGTIGYWMGGAGTAIFTVDYWNAT